MSETKEEFFAGYCRRSGISEEWARENGFEAEPCDCGEEGCRGWQMKTQRMPSTDNWKDAPMIHVRCSCGSWATATEKTLDQAGWVEEDNEWKCPRCVKIVIASHVKG